MNKNGVDIDNSPIGAFCWPSSTYPFNFVRAGSARATTFLLLFGLINLRWTFWGQIFEFGEVPSVLGWCCLSTMWCWIRLLLLLVLLPCWLRGRFARIRSLTSLFWTLLKRLLKLSAVDDWCDPWCWVSGSTLLFAPWSLSACLMLSDSFFKSPNLWQK